MFNLLKEQILKAPKDAGVYQFLGEDAKVLYVGKAKNLKNRLKSYLDTKKHNSRISRMLFHARSVDITKTQSENEALLLENNLIKKFMPRYNILLRDDKTFANILVDLTHPFPSISKHRGKKIIKGKYFGPFANGTALYETIGYLKKIFLLRSCSDNEFKSRKTPCLEYQIKRCSAPCVGLISQDEYGKLIKEILDFLSGKKSHLQENLAKEMQEKSSNLEFEKARVLRDRIKALSIIQAKQNIHLANDEDVDFIAITRKGNLACALISFFRKGNNYGSKSYFLKIEQDDSNEEIADAFLEQFYSDQDLPNQIVIGFDSFSVVIPAKAGIQSLSEAFPDSQLRGNNKVGGYKLRFLQDYLKIANQELDKKIAAEIKGEEMLIQIKNLFNLPKIPQRIEIYDNSHTSGQFAVGAFVVASLQGFIKNAYRKFNIRIDELDGKDDTAFLKQVLTRRFKKTEENLSNNPSPDLIIIDGGKGQLNAAKSVFKEMGIEVPFVCMSKGENRNAGEEQFHMIGKSSFTLEKHSPLMHYLQNLRDEAHRFAIGFNRAKRAKSVTKSELDEIPNIGKLRKKLLLNHFGSVAAIKEASIEDLMRVKGISKNVAVKIADFFRTNNTIST